MLCFGGTYSGSAGPLIANCARLLETCCNGTGRLLLFVITITRGELTEFTVTEPKLYEVGLTPSEPACVVPANKPQHVTISNAPRHTPPDLKTRIIPPLCSRSGT